MIQIHRQEENESEKGCEGINSCSWSDGTWYPYFDIALALFFKVKTKPSFDSKASIHYKDQREVSMLKVRENEFQNISKWQRDLNYECRELSY